MNARDIFDGAAAEYELKIAEEAERQRIQREARRRVLAEERGPVPEPTFATLRDRLSWPRLEARWRIHGWQATDSRVMLAAQFKAGKTTLVGNAIRSLVDGDPWLGRDRVEPIPGTLALIDNEMSESKLIDWLRDNGIQSDDRVHVVPLRGRVASFDLLDARIRAQWAERFRGLGTSYLILDCLRPVLDVLGLDEHRDAGRFLVAFDALLAEAGIPEALVVQHMGHVAERARGDSRLRDWPDVEWRLVRQDDDPASPRYIAAYGRDVDQPEAALAYDAETRRLTIAGGSRKDGKVDAALDAVLDVLAGAHEPLSGRAIKQALAESEHPRDTLDAALRHGVATDALTMIEGPRRAKLYRSVRVSGSVRPVSEEHTNECPAASIEADTRSLTQSGSVSGFQFDPRGAFLRSGTDG